MHVIVNCAMSLDGRIEGKFSNDKDWKRVYELRAECDAVMVGINTILKDNSGLTSHGVGKNPLIVVVDSKCRIPSDARVFEGNVVVGVCEGVKTDAVWMARTTSPRRSGRQMRIRRCWVVRNMAVRMGGGRAAGKRKLAAQHPRIR